MTLFKTSIFTIATTALLVSCGGSSEADDDLSDLMDEYNENWEAPEEVDRAPVEVSWEELISKDLLDGQNVIFEGYVGMLPSTLYNYDSQEMTIDFYPRRNQIEGEKMRVDVPIGSSPGHAMELPDEYAQSDLRIICEEGTTARVGAYVKIEGSYTNSTSEYYNYLDLTKITVLENTFDEAIFDSAVELTNEVIEDSTKDDVYSYMDVSLSTSLYMMPYDGKYPVDISQRNNSFLKSAYIYIGSNPGRMDQLTDGFTDKDFIVYDYNGDAQKAASGKYRIFGTFNQLSVEAKGMFTVEEIKKL